MPFAPIFPGGDNLLRASLLDLLHELREADIPLIIGGGYGIYLKQRFVAERQPRTLIETLPAVRSTRDLDLFLRTELLADSPRARLLADALERLGYEVVPGRERYQYRKTVEASGQSHEVKIDLLTRDPPDPLRSRLEVERIHVKPKPKAGIHAYRTEEAVAIEDEPTELHVEGALSTGEPFSGSILLPQPFAYALLKLFAFRDQMDDEDERRGRGRHHAMDLFAILAMMTEEEYERARRFSEKYANESTVIEGGRIVQKCFANPEGLGILRMRESSDFSSELDLETFTEVLQEIFPFRLA